MRHALTFALISLLVSSCREGPSNATSWFEVVVHKPGAEITDPAMRQKIEDSGLPWKVRDRATGVEMVLIMPGEFMMGSPESEPGHRAEEGPRHRVRLTRAFYLGTTEITQAQWKAATGEAKGFFKGEDRPANVSWDDLEMLFAKVNADLPPGVAPMRAPTEAEWEYACRAGTTGPFNFEGPPRHAVMNYVDGDAKSALASNGDHIFEWNTPPSPEARLKAAPAGSMPPNAWGLHEMHGNVREWTADKYRHDAYAGRGDVTVDPIVRGGEDEPNTLRGGDWYRKPERLRSAVRTGAGRYAGSSRIGARIARTAKE